MSKPSGDGRRQCRSAASYRQRRLRATAVLVAQRRGRDQRDSIGSGACTPRDRWRVHWCRMRPMSSAEALSARQCRYVLRRLYRDFDDDVPTSDGRFPHPQDVDIAMPVSQFKIARLLRPVAPSPMPERLLPELGPVPTQQNPLSNRSPQGLRLAGCGDLVAISWDCRTSAARRWPRLHGRHQDAAVRQNQKNWAAYRGRRVGHEGRLRYAGLMGFAGDQAGSAGASGRRPPQAASRTVGLFEAVG